VSPFEENKMKQSFTPVRVGRYTLPNRLVMAPMTRSRAKIDGTPGEVAAEYYSQRASVGLIVAEGTQPSDDGQGYLTTPGIYTPAHVAGWKKVTRAVHDKGGRIFIQIMHAGRMSHPDVFSRGSRNSCRRPRRSHFRSRSPARVSPRWTRRAPA
jgi:N-ethylmaleimide reductase